VVALVLAAAGCGSGSSSSNPLSSFPPATVPLVKLSTDTFTNATSQHATEVEPDSFAFGSTIVSAFQVGRISGGGASDIGYAISTDAGVTWNHGLLPGLTTFPGRRHPLCGQRYRRHLRRETWGLAHLFAANFRRKHLGRGQPFDGRRRDLEQSDRRGPRR
jgi:hypothetical protein